MSSQQVTIQRLVAVAVSLAGFAAPSHASVVNVQCFGNGDGTVSCQRLRDGEWFDCTSSSGGVNTCKSREVVPGRDDPITCTDQGGGIFVCTTTAREPGGRDAAPTSVFGF